jgi:VanZ family protein
VLRAHIIAFRVVLIVGFDGRYATRIHAQQYPVLKDISDKANRIFAFYVLALLVDFSFPKDSLGFSKVIALLSYGLLIEVIQNFLPHRNIFIARFACDGVGFSARVRLAWMNKLRIFSYASLTDFDALNRGGKGARSPADGL